MGFFWYNAHRRTEEEAAKQRAPGAADRRELSEKETQAQKCVQMTNTGTSEMEVIRIYEVYIDIYFIENVSMDAQLLLLTLLLLKEKIIPWRLILASLIGGVGSVLIFLSGIHFGVGYIFVVILLDAFILFLCMKNAWKRKALFQRLIMGIIYLHGMAFAYTRFMECADRLDGRGTARILAAALVLGIVIFILIYRRFMERGRIYRVVLTQEDENVEFRALFDTGNLLTDPISGKPVSVIEETERMKQWLEKYPQKYKVIPYQSIGNEHGILEGMTVDELMIQKEEEQVVKKETVIALYKGKLSKNGAFQMILNHNLI